MTPDIASGGARAHRFDHEAAIAEVAAGATMQAVADRYGVSRERIRQIVRRAGIVPTRGHDFSASMRAEVPDLVRLGLPDEMIADELGLPVSRVATERRKAGLSPRARVERMSCLLDEHLAAGGSLRSFCLAHGAPECAAQALAKTLNHDLRHGPHRDLSHRPAIIAQCRSEGMTWARIAERLSEREGRFLGSRAIHNWARNHVPHLLASSSRGAPDVALSTGAR